jgi:hypothetical protein
MNYRIPTAILTAMMVCSCAPSVSVLRSDSAIYPAKDISAIQILLDEPEKKYRSIALIEVSDDGNGFGLETLRKSMATEAAKLGGDAVIVSRQSEETTGALIPVGKTMIATTNKVEKLKGRVIVFLPD